MKSIATSFFSTFCLGDNLLDGFLDGFFAFSLCASWGISHGLPFPSKDK
jgi:hypothetical protein